jgi:hypothetical protein
VLDVEVDVGRSVALEREEALEQQAQIHRVGLGDAERVADRAVGRAPPALAVDVVDAAELHDVDEHQEVAREVEPLDHVELVGDLAHRLRVLGVGGGIAHARAAGGELAQPRHLGVAVGHIVVGELGGGHAQVERARMRELHRARHRAGPTGEAALLLRRATQVRERCGGQPAVELVERTAGTHRSQRSGERTARRSGVVHVVGGHDVDPGGHRHPRQGVVAVAIEGIAVIPHLHQHAVATEGGDEPVERGTSRARTVAHQCRGDGALATAGEHVPAVVARARLRVEVHRRARGMGQRVDGGARCALLSRHLCRTDRARQPCVAHRPLGQDDEVLALRVGFAVGRPGDAQRELGPEDRGQVELPGGEREADRAVETVVVGDRETDQPQARRLLRQLFRVAGAVEEGEVGVAVQLGVPHGDRDRIEHVFATASGTATTGPASPAQTRSGC